MTPEKHAEQIRQKAGKYGASSPRHPRKGEHMNINSDGAEIDRATDFEVYGEWIKFTDGEGATVKITPSVVAALIVFAIKHVNDFEEGAWE